MTPEEWQFLTQQGVHTTNPVQPLTEEQASVAKIPLYMTPVVGQGLAGYDAYHSASQGNYGTAAAEAAMGFLPVHKPVLAALNALKRNALPVAAAGAVTALPTDAEAAPSYNGIEGLYSRMAEAVKGWSGKNTGANWLGRLKNEPGVPGAELKWSPARKWLEQSAEKPITAEELKAYIDSNPIPISQKTLGYPSNEGAHYTQYSLPGETNLEQEKLFHFNPQARKNPKDMTMDEIFQSINDDVPVDPNYRAPHFAGHHKNLAAHTRTNIRELPNGEKAYHVEEIQSDWAQKGRDEGFLNPEKPIVAIRWDEAGREHRLGEFANVDEADKFLASQPGFLRSGTDEGFTYGTRDLASGSSQTPMMPLAEEQKGLPLYGSMAFRKNLYDAAKSGADHMTWTTGKQQAERFPDEKNVKGMSEFYDRKMRKIAEIEAKRLGIKPEEHIGQQSLGDLGVARASEDVSQGLLEHAMRMEDEGYPAIANALQQASQYAEEGRHMPAWIRTIVAEHVPEYTDPEKVSEVVHSFKLTPELRKQILEKGLPFLGIGAGAKILKDQGAAPAPLDVSLQPGA